MVDDDREIVIFLEAYLTMNGHDVVEKAFDGEQAVSIYQNLIAINHHSLDIVLLDHWMPRKDGLKTAKEILKINPKCKIIFMSSDYTVKKEALQVGAISFIEKPRLRTELLAELGSFSQRSQRS
ncbi:MAG: response regulator [Candidatus Odinarchaeota archaeon]